MRVIFVTFIVIYTIFSLFGCSEFSAQEIPAAENGVLDLTNWDISESAAIPLHGEWLFSWKELVAPAAPMPPVNSSLIELPGYWNRHKHSGADLPSHGWASYRLNILLPETRPLLGINLKSLHTSYELYADSKLISSAGHPGTDSSSSLPYFKQDTVFFNAENDVLILTLHLSNFHLGDAGIWESIFFGDAETLRLNGHKRLALEIFLLSCIFSMGLYHLGIFIYRREDKASLYFGLFCMLIALRGLTTGEIFLQKMFPDLAWIVLLKIEYFCFYAAVPLFLMYFNSIFPDDTHKPVLRGVQAAALLFVLQVILTPPLLFTKTLEVYQAITALSCLYTIFILIKAIIRKRPNSSILLAGFLVMFAAFVNDVLHADEIIHTGLILPAGLFVFIFSQAILILNRLNRAYTTVEQQRNELVRSSDLFERSRLGTILGLAKLAEYRDEDTGKHLERIREYCKIIAEELSEKEGFQNYITEKYINDLYQSAILHDIGKVAVPDSILLKPGKLDSSEFDHIKKHTEIGGDALLNIESQTDMKSFLTLGKEIAWFHHEKWDGSGYPKGLSGESIPLSARITAVADVYDALTSERPYKKAFSHEKAKNIIIEGRGSHFDPLIVDIFIALESEFNSIRFSHQDA